MIFNNLLLCQVMMLPISTSSYVYSALIFPQNYVKMDRIMWGDEGVYNEIS